MTRAEILEGADWHLSTDSTLGGNRLAGVQPYEDGREVAEGVSRLLLSDFPIPPDMAITLRRLLATLLEAE